MTSPPRDGIEAFAQMAGVARTTARNWLRRLPDSEAFTLADAQLRAEAQTAGRDAAASLDEFDVLEVANAVDPEAALREMIEVRTDRQLTGRLGAHESWARTKDRTARTAPARAAFEAKFLTEADGDPVRAEHLRKAHYLRMALKSAQARRRGSRSG